MSGSLYSTQPSYSCCSPNGSSPNSGNPGLTWKLDIQKAWRRKYRIRLETPRFLLRPLIADDVDWLGAIFTDPEVNRFLVLNVPCPHSCGYLCGHELLRLPRVNHGDPRLVVAAPIADDHRQIVLYG